MKILLINPPRPDMIGNTDLYVPSGLLYLAAVLQKIDVLVELLDLNVVKSSKNGDPAKSYEDAIIDKLMTFKPQMVGLGCLFSGQFPSVLNYSKKIKEFSNNITIVIGGIHPTIYPKDILTHCPSIDWIVLGEGETAIVQLVNAVRDQNNNYEKIDGFAFRHNNSVIVNQKKSFIVDLDTLPNPAYNLINIKDYYFDTSHWHNPKNLVINTSLSIISSRSCPIRCNFCSMFLVMGPKWRSRTPQNVVSEIEYLYNERGQRHFSFMDDNLTLDKKHILAVCRLILKKKLSIQFETPNGIAIRTLDAEVLEAMVEAGLTRVALAIESGSDHIRNSVMGKNLPRKMIYEIFDLTKKFNDLIVKAFFIIGMPEDTPQTLNETYSMIKEIDVDRPMVSNLMPFPGTRLFDQAVRDNLFLETVDLKNIWKFDKFYYTNNKRFFIKPYKMTVEELNDYRARFDALTEGIIDKKKMERRCRNNEHMCEKIGKKSSLGQAAGT